MKKERKRKKEEKLASPQREMISKFLFEKLGEDKTISNLESDYGSEIFAINLGQVELSDRLPKSIKKLQYSDIKQEKRRRE